ncbi:transglycosylase domain-containing protein [Mycoplasmatota bacterium WC44]
MKSLIKPLLIVTSSITLLLVIFFTSVLYKTPELDLSKLKYPDTTIIYDSNGETLINLGIEKRKYTTIEDISPIVIEALIATEDKKFYEHNGIDWKRFIAAALQNVKTRSFSEGASTITQQILKNTHLTQVKTIERKMQEMYLAYQLEKVLDKDSILEYYLNISPFGGTVYGIESASQYYFNKSNIDLTLSEAALLVGILQLPNAYNPYKHLDYALERRDLVLNIMYKEDIITYTEYSNALLERIDDNLENGIKSNGYDTYSDFIDYVIKEAKEKYGVDLYEGGVKVYTTLDKDIQKTMFESVNTINNYEGIESAVVTLNTNSEIKGIISSKKNDYALSLSYAVDVPLQVASTIKPILDYGPLIEYNKYSTAHPFLDEEIQYSSGQIVQNWDLQYKGYVTLRKALVESRNVPAIKAYRIGKDYGYTFASNLGLEPEEIQVEPHAIGGFSNGYTVLEMTTAYNAFPNNGLYKDSFAITKIVFQNGDEIVVNPESTQVMKSSTAFMVTDMLKDVVTSFGYQGFTFPNMVVAGKTGQSNYPEDVRNSNDIPTTAVKDLWFIGYSNEYTIGVWSGGTDLKHYVDTSSKRLSRKIFQDIMLKVDGSNSSIIPKPKDVVSVNVEIENSEVMLPSEYTPIKYIKNEYFIKGTEPSVESTKFHPLDTPTNIKMNYSVKAEKLFVSWDEVKPNNEDLGKILYEVSLIKNGDKTILSNDVDTDFTFSVGLFALLFYDEIEIRAHYSSTEDFSSDTVRIDIDVLKMF